MKNNRQKIINYVVFAALIGSMLPLSGCSSVTISILSNNNLLTTRSQALGTGEASGTATGGGSPTISPELDFTALP